MGEIANGVCLQRNTMQPLKMKGIKSLLILMSTEYYMEFLNHCIAHLKPIYHSMLTTLALKF